MKNKYYILESYKATLDGEKSKINLNLQILLDNPTSIPEHTDYFTDLDSLIGRLAEIQDKIEETNHILQQLDA
tara:strand:- start:738 stop:956 length:219 start_codon:yes stop_codon:yes gene_type:complete